MQTDRFSSEEATLYDQTMDYRGYQIVLKPMAGSDGIWFGGYELSRNGAMISSRLKIYPGFHYFKAACSASIQNAKIEIENLRRAM